MSAAITDKFKKGYGFFSTTLSAQKNSGASSMSLSDATGVPTTTGLVFTVGRVNSSGTSTPSTRAIYKGTLSGTTVSNLTLTEGTDQTHAAGSVVEITFTATHWNDAIDGILAEHEQDGTHKAITTPSIVIDDAGTLDVDTINEATAAAGVTIDGLNIKDSALTTAASVPSESLNATIACKAYRSAAFNITGAGGVEKIPLDAESFDLGSDWDTTNGRFVTPVTGYYQVNATIRATSVNANGVLVVEIDVDGGAVAYNSSPGTVNAQSMSCSISDIIYATSGQYIELYGDCSTTEAVTTGAANTFMSIYFIGV